MLPTFSDRGLCESVAAISKRVTEPSESRARPIHLGDHGKGKQGLEDQFREWCHQLDGNTQLPALDPAPGDIRASAQVPKPCLHRHTASRPALTPYFPSKRNWTYPESIVFFDSSSDFVDSGAGCEWTMHPNVKQSFTRSSTKR